MKHPIHAAAMTLCLAAPIHLGGAARAFQPTDAQPDAAATNPVALTTATYVLEIRIDGETIGTIFTRREQHLDGSFTEHSRSEFGGTTGTSTQAFTAEGHPTRSESVFAGHESSIHYARERAVIDYRGEATTVDAGRAGLASPHRLWFWKHDPEPDTPVVETSVSQNTGSLMRIEYRYLRAEPAQILGTTLPCHVVRDTPLDAAGDVYTDTWYDERGMAVRRVHVVGGEETITELIAINPPA
ncbi:MAG: hypothetical protein DHS20C14_12060 [Phycisphaeraceae bacterium]|nr:MAG: hypothetical protein DHS20C14_12060 [Phycisphaeraceae bacterium]